MVVAQIAALIGGAVGGRFREFREFKEFRELKDSRECR